MRARRRDTAGICRVRRPLDGETVRNDSFVSWPVRRPALARGLAVLAAAAGCGAASAGVVTTEASFNRFVSGALGAGSLYVTRVNGQNVTPAGGNEVIPIDVDLPAGTTSVTYETQIPDFFVPPVNRVGFRASPSLETPSLPVGTELLLGELSLSNGSWSAALASIAFTVTVRLDGDAVGTWSDVLEHRTLVGATPEENADSFGFRDHPALGTVRVLEAGTAFVQIYGRIGSLVPTRFGTVSGDGFLVGATGTVPVPATLLLALAALGVAALARPCRREAQL